MKRLKYTFWRFREYEGAAFSEYLDEMAKKGWCLESIASTGALVFEKKEWNGGRFCAAVVPGETEFSDEESEEKRKFCELCEEAGWELRYSGELWQIFYSNDKDALPIETDPDLRLQAMKKNLFSGWRVLGIALISAVLLFAMAIIYYRMADPEELNARYQLIALMLAQGYILYEPISSLLWYGGAERELSEGGPLPSTDMETIRRRTWVESIFLFCDLILAIKGGIGISLIFAYLMFDSYRAIVTYTIAQKDTPKDDRVWVVVRLAFVYITLLLGLLALAYNLVMRVF